MSSSQPSPSSGGTTWHAATTTTHSPPCRAVRKDRGQVSLAAAIAQRRLLQYRDYPHWSYRLHDDNLAALVKADPALGRLPSYSTVKRYMQTHGWVRQPRPERNRRPGEAVALARRQTHEVRSYEAAYVGSLWHL